MVIKFSAVQQIVRCDKTIDIETKKKFFKIFSFLGWTSPILLRTNMNVHNLGTVSELSADRSYASYLQTAGMNTCAAYRLNDLNW